MVDFYSREPLLLNEAKRHSVYSDSYRGKGPQYKQPRCPKKEEETSQNQFRCLDTAKYLIPWKIPETVTYEHKCRLNNLLRLSQIAEEENLQSTYRNHFAYKFNAFKTPASALLLCKQPPCNITLSCPKKMPVSKIDSEPLNLRLHPLEFDFPQLMHSEKSASPDRMDYFSQRHLPQDPRKEPEKQSLPCLPPESKADPYSDLSWNRFPVDGCIEPTNIIPPPLRAPETNPCQCSCSCCTRLDGKGRCYCAVPCDRSTYKNVPFPSDVEFNYLQGNYKCPRLLDDCLIDHCRPPSQAALREEFDHKRRIPRRALQFGVGCEHKCRHQCLIATQRSLPLPPHLQNVAKTYSPLFRKSKHIDEAAEQRIQAALQMKKMQIMIQKPVLGDSSALQETTDFIKPRLHYGLTKCHVPSSKSMISCPV